MSTSIRATSSGSVLVFEAEFERRIEAAARLTGIDPTEFIARAVQQRCVEVLGEGVAVGGTLAGTAATDSDRLAASNAAQTGEAFDRQLSGPPWAIRPTPDRVLRTVAEVSGLPIETLVGPGRGRAVARARAVVAYLLCNDAGLPVHEAARIIHRKSPTVAQLTRTVAQIVGSTDPQAELLERARRRLRSGISSGKPYPPLPTVVDVAKLLPGLLACRLASGLNQPELAQRAGITRETVARLERLRRRARPETVDRLAEALAVPARSLTTATRDLPLVRRLTRRPRGSEN